MQLTDTQKMILDVGKREFLDKGFKDASLRGIVKDAGFTQGAFYGYYKDKAALSTGYLRQFVHLLTSPPCSKPCATTCPRRTP